MITHKRKLTEFYQVVAHGKFHWKGLKVFSQEEIEERRTRRIEVDTQDILIKSEDGKHYNRINYSGAVNIAIPASKIVKRVINLDFDEEMYEQGFTCNS